MLKFACLLSLACGCLIVSARADDELSPSATASEKPILVFNEDDSHFFVCETNASRNTLLSYIDKLAAYGRVTHFFMCPNAMRANFDSKTFEPIWKSIDKPGVKAGSKVHSLKRLHDSGVDPYAVWIGRCREKGIQPWISMRMNDVHGVTDPSYCSLSTFWRQHPELRRVPGSKSSDWSHYAFDFSHGEVREHHLAFVKELFDRYDMDGFEADWLRFFWHLTPGKEREQSRHLTEFMREVRKIARTAEARRGHRILVGARVASTPKLALSLGTDAIAWAKEGLVDWIVPCNFFTTVDFDLPIDDWQRQVASANPAARVIPGLDVGLRLFRNRRMLTSAECRGWSELQYARGAKGIYLFNYFSPRMLGFVESGCFDVSRIADLPRAYPVSYRDTALNIEDRDRQVPVPCGEATAAVNIPIGRPPSKGAAAVLVAFDASVPNVAEAIRLNGWAPKSVEMFPGEKWLAPNDVVGASFKCRFPVEALVSGTNTVSVAPFGVSCKLLACELIIEPIADEKTSDRHRIVARDSWYGYSRKVFEFHRREAWIVEPKAEAKGRPWVWIMEWPEAFAKRTGSVALLNAGYHVVTLRPGHYENGKFMSRPGNMNNNRLSESRTFQKYLVDELHFAPKANLIGMSWGGFYSVRYAGTYPEAVARIYLDAPLLDFSSLAGKERDRWDLSAKYGIDIKAYVGKDDPRQPVNMYEPIAKAGIPVLLLYGGSDATVPPSGNCLRFAESFKSAGGDIEIVARESYGHHPHGLEIDEQQKFVDFFNGKKTK